MKRFLLVSLVVVFVLSFAGLSSATNGDNLIGVGPIARSMGGVGIAAPQDALSAIFANPAALCFGPYCPGSEVNVDATVFMPKANTRIQMPAYGIDTGGDRSESDFYVIPALALSVPINEKLRFGFGAYGVSGLGVDYRKKFDLDPTPGTGHQDMYTDLSIMKIAPNLAYMITPNLSVGASLHINMGVLDLQHRDGTSTGWALGGQVGAIYKNGPVSLGLVYVTPQKVKHKGVADFDLDGSTDTLALESPQSVGVGVAVEPIQNVLLVELDVKWINWADAIGYRDFGWRDQWNFAVGTQYKPTSKLALRVGYNYAKSPIKAHSWTDFDGFIDVQGKDVPRTNYEILRISGFPAIVEHHVTAGIGYEFTKNVSLNIGYMHAFKNTIEEKGTAVHPVFGVSSASVRSDLYEDSIDFGLTYRF